MNEPRESLAPVAWVTKERKVAIDGIYDTISLDATGGESSDSGVIDTKDLSGKYA